MKKIATFASPESSPGCDDVSPSSRSLRGAGVYLYAGQIVVSAEPCTITTIVGSCIMVCLLDTVIHAGGANHYLLPTCPPAAAASPRFGDVAIEEMIVQMLALGSRSRDLRAKLFGGSSITQVSEHMGEQSLGMKNVLVARQILAARGIPVVAEDVGGNRGRKIIFRTDVGEAHVKRL